jgi:hypothetical protein
METETRREERHEGIAENKSEMVSSVTLKSTLSCPTEPST